MLDYRYLMELAGKKAKVEAVLFYPPGRECERKEKELKSLYYWQYTTPPWRSTRS